MTTPVKEKKFPDEELAKLPRPFILRRLHSFLGLWLVLYLFEHLLVNSQAAFFFKDDGRGFVSMVNKIHNTPYLKAIELLFLGIPFFIHGVWGIKYALTAKINSKRTDKTTPELPQYKRNKAYTWQRLTSWLLLFAIAAHVFHMRFLEYPVKTQHGDTSHYMVRLKFDASLPLVAEKLFVPLFDQEDIREKEVQLEAVKKQLDSHAEETSNFSLDEPYYQEWNQYLVDKEWLRGAEKKPLKSGQVLAVAPNAGAAFLLIVRQAFQNPLMVILYSILVIAACYHAFNGLWTFMITWGITLTRRSQKTFRKFTTVMMWIVSLMGLWAAWGTYWTTLLQK